MYNFSKNEKVQEPEKKDLPAPQQEQGEGENESIDAEQLSSKVKR